MRIDVHNHAVPDAAIALLNRDPAYGATVVDGRLHSGVHVPFELVPSFLSASAKLAELEERELEAAVVSVSPTLFYYHVDAEPGEAMARAVNAGLAAMAAERPDRLRWMASVPLQAPARAVAVLEDALAAGAVGVEVGTSAGPGKRLDDRALDPFWAAAERLGLPVMLHPVDVRGAPAITPAACTRAAFAAGFREMRHVAAPTAADLADAAAVVGERLAPTPLVPAPALGEDVHLKLETFQPTGSFKVRGGLAALSRASGPVVTASAGNAGLGIAWAALALGVPATIVVAENASPAKVAALAALPITLVQHGSSYDEAEAHALAYAAGAADVAYVSSYNDTGVIAGQSSLGRELEAQLGAPLTVVCPLGGGSIASGLGLWAAGRDELRVVAIEAERSPAFTTALAAGEITAFVVGDTLADGLAGNLEPGSATFPLVRDHVAALAQVSEDEIADAIRFLARAHGVVAEGAGAVGVAAVMTGRVLRGPGPLAVVVTGRNIALPRLAEILAGG